MEFNAVFNNISVILQRPVNLSMLFWSSFYPFPNKPWFLRVCGTNLLKTLREKEKLLVRAISPFHTLFSTVLENFLPFSSNLKLSSANSISLEESKICHLGKELSSTLHNILSKPLAAFPHNHCRNNVREE